MQLFVFIFCPLVTYEEVKLKIMRYNVDSISLHGRVILNITLIVMKLHALANF